MSILLVKHLIKFWSAVTINKPIIRLKISRAYFEKFMGVTTLPLKQISAETEKMLKIISLS